MKLNCYPVHLVKRLLVASFLANFSFASNETFDSHWVEHIIPANYVKMHHPTHHLWGKNITKTTGIFFYFFPRNVMSVEPKTMDFAVDLEIYIAWIDERLIIPENMSEENSYGTDVPKEVAVKLWTPNIYLGNCKACDDYLADPSIQRLKLSGKGVSMYLAKTYKFTCAIDLRNYPFDAQQCKITIHKWGNKIQVPYQKRSTLRDIPPNKINVPPEFELTRIKWTNCTEEEWMECSEFAFRFRRMIANHVMLVFIPSMLIVILSWISFWLDVEVAAPRVALGLTSLLTLATQLNNSQRNLPPVSAIKAVDIWMFACMFMVFGSLIEFAVANSWARRKKNTAKVAPVTTVKSTVKSPLANIRRRSIKRQIVITKTKTPVPLSATHPSPIDFIARIAFPVSYIIFNIVFWGYFATKQQ